jgi:hypothetical protein
MRLKVEPVTIPVALFQSQLVRLKEVSATKAVVQVGGRKFPFRFLTFILKEGRGWEDMECVHQGPALSRFLLNEARVLAFLNMQRANE